MYLLALLLLIFLVSSPSRLPEPHKCLPWSECPDCHGTGIIKLDDNESIECYCTTKWR